MNGEIPPQGQLINCCVLSRAQSMSTVVILLQGEDGAQAVWVHGFSGDGAVHDRHPHQLQQLQQGQEWRLVHNGGNSDAVHRAHMSTAPACDLKSEYTHLTESMIEQGFATCDGSSILQAYELMKACSLWRYGLELFIDIGMQDIPVSNYLELDHFLSGNEHKTAVAHSYSNLVNAQEAFGTDPIGERASKSDILVSYGASNVIKHLEQTKLLQAGVFLGHRKDLQICRWLPMPQAGERTFATPRVGR